MQFLKHLTSYSVRSPQKTNQDLISKKNKKTPIINLLTPVWPDRDDFIRVHEENIDDEMKPNFVKRPFGNADFGVKGSVDTENSPYDTVSANSFEKRGCLVFLKLFPNV